MVNLAIAILIASKLTPCDIRQETGQHNFLPQHMT
jgi:hypothetical protein